MIPLRRTIYTLLRRTDAFLGLRNSSFILCYHSFAGDGWRFSVDTGMLRRQLEILKKEGYAFATLDQLSGYIRRGESLGNCAIITIDDGYQNVMEALPIFEEYGIKPAIFILSDPQHANRAELDSQYGFLSDAQLNTLLKRGWTIGSHGATHANIQTLAEGDMEREITHSKRSLEKRIGHRVRYFAYPKGKYSALAVKIAQKAGYELALSMDDEIITQVSGPFTVSRIGVDGTHSLQEFRCIYSPSALRFRRMVKKSPLGAYL
jgi:peptidoglycan/xylan/chitin deacetylase (PgdA/CDA1 family)